MKNKKIEFVSYSGQWPCLCNGTLCIRVDSEEYFIDGALSSGGGVWFDDDWSEHVESDDWNISSSDLPLELKPYIEEITYLVNDNVPRMAVAVVAFK